MATRRSSRLAEENMKMHRVQETMIFPFNIARDIIRDYVDLFRGDSNANILPLLTSCHTISELVIPLLYQKVTLVTQQQCRSFFKTVTPSSFLRIKSLEIQSIGANGPAVKDLGDRIQLFKAKQQKETTQELSPPEQKEMKVSSPNASNGLTPSFDTVRLFNPTTLICPQMYIGVVFRNLAAAKLPDLREVEGRADDGTLQICLQEGPFQLDVVHFNLRVDSVDIETSVTLLSDILQTGYVKERITLSIVGASHVFCFEDGYADVKAANLDVWLRRGCPEGKPCCYDRASHPVSQEEVSVRDALRPGWEELTPISPPTTASSTSA